MCIIKWSHVFDLWMEPYHVLTLRVNVVLRIEAMKEHITFPKAPELKPHYQMQPTVILRTLVLFDSFSFFTYIECILMSDMPSIRDFPVRDFFFMNWLNTGTPWWSSVEKTDHDEKTHWLSGKEKVPGSAVIKKDDAPGLLKEKRIHPNWFLKKHATENSVSDCQLLRQYFTLFIEWPSYKEIPGPIGKLFIVLFTVPQTRISSALSWRKVAPWRNSLHQKFGSCMLYYTAFTLKASIREFYRI